MIDLIRRMHPAEFQWSGANNPQARMLTVDRHAGTKKLKEAIENGTLKELLANWEQQQQEFLKLRAPYLLYK